MKQYLLFPSLLVLNAYTALPDCCYFLALFYCVSQQNVQTPLLSLRSTIHAEIL